MSQTLRELLQGTPVIPVLRIEDVAQAVPLARALVAGGLKVLEVTLRTPVAFEAIEAIARAVPQAVIGAGTLIRPQQCVPARRAGARFAVSPGLTEALARAARGAELPLLPGVMTPGEAMHAQALGFDTLKLFPASVAGGLAWLRAIHAPLPDLAFCPTGGISEDQLRDYLGLPNVLCVGGSWLAPASLLQAGDWDGITRLAARSLAAARADPQLARGEAPGRAPRATGEEDPGAGMDAGSS